MNQQLRQARDLALLGGAAIGVAGCMAALGVWALAKTAQVAGLRLAGFAGTADRVEGTADRDMRRFCGASERGECPE